MTAFDYNTANYIRIDPIEQSSFGLRTHLPMAGPLSLPSFWSPRTLLLRLFGGCMVVASTALWLVHSAGEDPKVVLIRIGATVVLMLLGVMVMLINNPAVQPEVEFDATAKELRLLERVRRNSKVVSRYPFDSLAGVQFRSGALTVFDLQGNAVVDVPLPDAHSRRMVQTQIAGHLAHLA